MTKENGSSVSARAMHNREWLAESPISDLLLPIGYIDPHNTMDRLCDHLESGGSAVCVTTHPSIEDIARAAKFLFQWPAIRNRRVGGPVAVHQMIFAGPLTAPFVLENAPMVTQHSLERKSYDRKTITKLYRGYNHLIIDILSKNGVLAVAPQADQEQKLTPPAKGVITVIFNRIQQEKLQNILFVPMGIEIQGIQDYSRARNITLQRHTYIFHVGKSYMDYELQKISEERGITPDYFMYIQQRQLVPPEYRSE